MKGSYGWDWAVSTYSFGPSRSTFREAIIPTSRHEIVLKPWSCVSQTVDSSDTNVFGVRWRKQQQKPEPHLRGKQL